MRAEKEQGLNTLAHDFVQKLRGRVHKGKMALPDALACLDCIPVFAEWAGLKDQGDLFREEAVDVMTARAPRPRRGGTPAEAPLPLAAAQVEAA